MAGFDVANVISFGIGPVVALGREITEVVDYIEELEKGSLPDSS